MKKKYLLITLLLISCNNDPLLDGMFSGSLINTQYILNLKFLNSKKAILFLPNYLNCNKYDFNQIELDVEKTDNNAIKLNFTNKDYNRSDLKDLLSFCVGNISLLKKIKWEDSKGIQYGFANLKLGEYIYNTPNEEILSNPLNYKLIPNSIYIKKRDLVYKLWEVAYRNGYNGNLIDFIELINTNSNAVKDLYEIAIKDNSLNSFIDDKSEYEKYSNLSINEFKTLLDIGYANVINEEYINVIESTRIISYINEMLIDKILIVNNLDNVITIGDGKKPYFKLTKK